MVCAYTFVLVVNTLQVRRRNGQKEVTPESVMLEALYVHSLLFT